MHIEEGYRISVAGSLSDTLSLYASHRSNEYSGPVNNWAREMGTPGAFDYKHVLDTVEIQLTTEKLMELL